LNVLVNLQELRDTSDKAFVDETRRAGTAALERARAAADAVSDKWRAASRG
jgi:hypothetical protein